MLGLRTWGLFAFAVIFAASFDEAESSDFDKSSVADEASDSGNATEGRYSAKRGDRAEVAGFEKYDDGVFDRRDSVAVIDFDAENASASAPVINKCCERNRYFDADDLACSPLEENPTGSEVFSGNVKISANGSSYSFREGFPDCGNRSVLRVRPASRVSIGATGATVDGEGVFPQYCVDGSSGRPLQAVVLTCHDPAALCGTRTCFRKCCPLGYSYGPSGRKCQKSNGTFRPEFYNLTTLESVDSAKASECGIYLGDACGPKGKYLLERDAGEVGYLGLGGNLLVPAFERRSFSGDEFCVEWVEMGNRNGMEAFLCFSKSEARFQNSPLQFFLLSLGVLISCAFLSLTFLVYLFSPKSQNLYGKTLMCYVACLFAAYLCLAVIELKSNEIDKEICTNMGYSLLFSFLAAFFWLNVMSFDIWKTFRLDRSADRSKTDEGGLRFFWYSLYAWSLPSAITAACAYANRTQGLPHRVVGPGIGEESCWFSKRRKGIYLFFVAPVSLVIASNVIFYVQTAWKIWKVKSDVSKMDGQGRKKFSANKEQFVINGKLFVVMGLTWSLEIISFFAPHPIWYVTDAANALHGVFIFAVFVLKKKVLRDVFRRLRAPLQRMRLPIRTIFTGEKTAPVPTQKEEPARPEPSRATAIARKTAEDRFRGFDVLLRKSGDSEVGSFPTPGEKSKRISREERNGVTFSCVAGETKNRKMMSGAVPRARSSCAADRDWSRPTG